MKSGIKRVKTNPRTVAQHFRATVRRVSDRPHIIMSGSNALKMARNRSGYDRRKAFRVGCERFAGGLIAWSYRGEAWKSITQLLPKGTF